MDMELYSDKFSSKEHRILCNSVNIGSFHAQAFGNSDQVSVLLNYDRFSFIILKATKGFTRITLKAHDINRILLHQKEDDLKIFIHPTPLCAERIRLSLDMEKGEEPCIDPDSDNSLHHYIILHLGSSSFTKKICSHMKLNFPGEKYVVEIDDTIVNEIMQNPSTNWIEEKQGSELNIGILQENNAVEELSDEQKLEAKELLKWVEKTSERIKYQIEVVKKLLCKQKGLELSDFKDDFFKIIGKDLNTSVSTNINQQSQASVIFNCTGDEELEAKKLFPYLELYNRGPMKSFLCNLNTSIEKSITDNQESNNEQCLNQSSVIENPQLTSKNINEQSVNKSLHNSLTDVRLAIESSENKETVPFLEDQSSSKDNFDSKCIAKTIIKAIEQLATGNKTETQTFPKTTNEISVPKRDQIIASEKLSANVIMAAIGELAKKNNNESRTPVENVDPHSSNKFSNVNEPPSISNNNIGLIERSMDGCQSSVLLDKTQNTSSFEIAKNQNTSNHTLNMNSNMTVCQPATSQCINYSSTHISSNEGNCTEKQNHENLIQHSNLAFNIDSAPKVLTIFCSKILLNTFKLYPVTEQFFVNISYDSLTGIVSSLPNGMKPTTICLKVKDIEKMLTFFQKSSNYFFVYITPNCLRRLNLMEENYFTYSLPQGGKKSYMLSFSLDPDQDLTTIQNYLKYVFPGEPLVCDISNDIEKLPTIFNLEVDNSTSTSIIGHPSLYDNIANKKKMKSYLRIPCTTIKIGTHSMKPHPFNKDLSVCLRSRDICFTVCTPDLEPKVIKINEIQVEKVLNYFGHKFAVLFIYVKHEYGKAIRKQFGIENRTIYNPESTDNRNNAITLLMKPISSTHCTEINNYLEDMFQDNFQEISQKMAIEILFSSTLQHNETFQKFYASFVISKKFDEFNKLLPVLLTYVDTQPKVMENLFESYLSNYPIITTENVLSSEDSSDDESISRKNVSDMSHELEIKPGLKLKSCEVIKNHHFNTLVKKDAIRVPCSAVKFDNVKIQLQVSPSDLIIHSTSFSFCLPKRTDKSIAEHIILKRYDLNVVYAYLDRPFPILIFSITPDCAKEIKHKLDWTNDDVDNDFDSESEDLKSVLISFTVDFKISNSCLKRMKLFMQQIFPGSAIFKEISLDKVHEILLQEQISKESKTLGNKSVSSCISSHKSSQQKNIQSKTTDHVKKILSENYGGKKRKEILPSPCSKRKNCTRSPLKFSRADPSFRKMSTSSILTSNKSILKTKNIHRTQSPDQLAALNSSIVNSSSSPVSSNLVTSSYKEIDTKRNQLPGFEFHCDICMKTFYAKTDSSLQQLKSIHERKHKERNESSCNINSDSPHIIKTTQNEISLKVFHNDDASGLKKKSDNVYMDSLDHPNNIPLESPHCSQNNEHCNQELAIETCMQTSLNSFSQNLHKDKKQEVFLKSSSILNIVKRNEVLQMWMKDNNYSHLIANENFTNFLESCTQENVDSDDESTSSVEIVQENLNVNKSIPNEESTSSVEIVQKNLNVNKSIPNEEVIFISDSDNDDVDNMSFVEDSDNESIRLQAILEPTAKTQSNSNDNFIEEKQNSSLSSSLMNQSVQQKTLKEISDERLCSGSIVDLVKTKRHQINNVSSTLNEENICDIAELVKIRKRNSTHNTSVLNSPKQQKRLKNITSIPDIVKTRKRACVTN